MAGLVVLVRLGMLLSPIMKKAPENPGRGSLFYYVKNWNREYICLSSICDAKIPRNVKPLAMYLTVRTNTTKEIGHESNTSRWHYARTYAPNSIITDERANAIRFAVRPGLYLGRRAKEF